MGVFVVRPAPMISARPPAGRARRLPPYCCNSIDAGIALVQEISREAPEGVADRPGGGGSVYRQAVWTE
jgi:hypothetical protein